MSLKISMTVAALATLIGCNSEESHITAEKKEQKLRVPKNLTVNKADETLKLELLKLKHQQQVLLIQQLHHYFH